jgi:hypothetical protein
VGRPWRQEIVDYRDREQRKKNGNARDQGCFYDLSLAELEFQQVHAEPDSAGHGSMLPYFRQVCPI